LSRFVGTGLGAGEVAIVIATRPHRELLAKRLTACGLDVTAVREQGRYVALDAAETLSKFLVDGWPDEARFAAVVGGVITRAAEGKRPVRVRAFGEMVALLCAEGRPEAAIRLEELWNNLARTMPFSLLCAYPMSVFSRKADGGSFRGICAAHAHVVPAESYTGLSSIDARLRTITHLQQKASALDTETAERRGAEKELADFLENAVEGLHRVGPDGKILWANRALLALLGCTAGEYVGHDLTDFYVRREVFQDFWAKLMRGETLYDYPAELRCKDGSVKQVLIHSNGLWEDGRFVHTRCFIRDVTQQNRLQAELEAKLELLADVDRRKDEFLAMLGHELRNPLSAVRNAIVAASLDPARRERALELARRQTDQLGRLVDDLVDVARITNGRIKLHTQRVRLASVVERAVETTRQLIEERLHAITLSLAGDVQVDADPTRLEQVVVNLLSNAAKYTEPGGRIEVTEQREGSEIALRVRDNGIGIAPEMLSCIFDLFAQADRNLDRAQGGLGIGLTVARRLVELHDGRIEAHSDGLGKGAEFVVRLPAPPEPRDEATEPARGESTQQRCARVLVVEDNPDAAESMLMLLELLGHQVRVAPEGLAAMDLARANVPDVMLIDIGLPGVDGYEIARRIRQDAALKHVILVALTGYGLEEDKRRALAAGFDHHLVKPVNIDALEQLVARVGDSERGPAKRTLH